MQAIIPVMLDQRVVPFERIHNFRDYGGYSLADGARLQRGRLFRSAHHHGATQSDLKSLADMRLAAVIDLRGDVERAASPCPRPEGFAAEVIFVEGKTASLAPHLAAAYGATDADQAREAMLHGYRTMPFRPDFAAILLRYFEALSRIDGPTIIHCMAGKDRTGFAVALFHAMMGVAWGDILDDYLLTNCISRIEDRITAAMAQIHATHGQVVGEDAMRILMTCDPTYLDAAFDTIRTSHGSVDDYLARVVGVTPERRHAIIARTTH